MAHINNHYMTVTVSQLENGLNLSAWMSTVEFWMSEISHFPYQYTYMGDACTWILHANTELTGKAINLLCEEADRICREQIARNEHRKISNR